MSTGEWAKPNADETFIRNLAEERATFQRGCLQHAGIIQDAMNRLILRVRKGPSAGPTTVRRVAEIGSPLPSAGEGAGVRARSRRGGALPADDAAGTADLQRVLNGAAPLTVEYKYVLPGDYEVRLVVPSGVTTVPSPVPAAPVTVAAGATAAAQLTVTSCTTAP